MVGDGALRQRATEPEASTRHRLLPAVNAARGMQPDGPSAVGTRAPLWLRLESENLDNGSPCGAEVRKLARRNVPHRSGRRETLDPLVEFGHGEAQFALRALADAQPRVIERARSEGGGCSPNVGHIARTDVIACVMPSQSNFDAPPIPVSQKFCAIF